MKEPQRGATLLLQMVPPPDFDDGRGLYPEPVKVHAPLGTRELLREAASLGGVSQGEFVRDALGRAVFDQFAAGLGTTRMSELLRRSTPEEIKSVASAANMNVGEFVRRAILDEA